MSKKRSKYTIKKNKPAVRGTGSMQARKNIRVNSR